MLIWWPQYSSAETEKPWKQELLVPGLCYCHMNIHCMSHLTYLAFQLLAQEFLDLNLSLFSSAVRTEAQYFKSRGKSYYQLIQQPTSVLNKIKLMTKCQSPKCFGTKEPSSWSLFNNGDAYLRCWTWISLTRKTLCDWYPSAETCSRLIRVINCIS